MRRVDTNADMEYHLQQSYGMNLGVQGACLMLTKHIRSAMALAKYEILSDGTFYGEIPGFQGVYATEETLEACREQLQEILEG